MTLADTDIERIARQEYLSWYPGAEALAAQWWAEDALATRTSRMRDMRQAVAAIEAAGYTITRTCDVARTRELPSEPDGTILLAASDPTAQRATEALEALGYTVRRLVPAERSPGVRAYIVDSDTDGDLLEWHLLAVVRHHGEPGDPLYRLDGAS